MPATSAIRMMTMGRAPSPRRNERLEIFMSEDEPGCLDYFSVANESSMLLHAGVSAEGIPRIHFELYEVPSEFLSILAWQLGRLWRIAPLDIGAREIAEFIGQPVKDDALVILRIRTVNSGIANARGRRRFGSDDGRHGERHQEQQKHPSFFHRAEINEASANVERRLGLGPLVDRHDFFANRFAHVFAQRAIQAIVLELLQDLRAPARTARDGKDRGEQIRRNA